MNTEDAAKLEVVLRSWRVYTRGVVKELPQSEPYRPNQSYCFGRFTFDLHRGSLCREDCEIKLRPKSFELLSYLVENSGRLVSKDELMRALWPDAAVTDDSLVQCVKEVRRALDDDSQVCIKTVPRRGYLFAAEVMRGVSSTRSRAPEPAEPIRLVPVQAVKRITITGSRFIWLVATLGLMLTAAGWFLWPRPAGLSSATQTIAVLPFRPLIEDAATKVSDEHLGVGMADALITQLSRIAGIVVRPTGAVLRYAGPQEDVRSAGESLRVDSVLQGNIQTSGDRIRVTVQLVSVRDGKPVWADKFDESLTGIFQLQDSIAEKIAESLRLKLTNADKERLRKRYSSNAKAYKLYLEGRYFWAKGEARSGIDYYRRTLVEEPDYAPAYAGLADCYSMLANRGNMAQNEALPAGKAAALRAVALDDTLAEAHASLGMIKSFYDWDWNGGEREFQRAIGLDPGSANVHFLYSTQLACVGRLNDALLQIGRALEIDPFAPIINLRMGYILYFQHKYDQAIEQHQKTIERNPAYAPAYMQLGWNYEQKEMLREAIVALEKAKALSADDPPVIASLARAYGIAGKRAEALKLLDELEALSKRRHVPPFWFAEAYVGLGDKNRAFEFLERGVQEHDVATPWMKMCPLCEPLHADPRFSILVRRMGLPL